MSKEERNQWYSTKKLITNKYLLGGMLLLNFILMVVLVLTLSNQYFIGKELETLTSRCYDSGGTAEMEIQDLSAGKYSFQCVRN
ncbi:hypothetical protein [Bacillus sp. AK031]